MKNVSHVELTVGQVLATNITNALKVAGPQDDYGNPRRIKASQVQRRSGIARSTLRALKTCCADHEPNPDLRTLERVADELCVPVAFLLMGPRQWSALLGAFRDMEEMLKAACAVDSELGLRGPQAAVQILRLLKVHPLELPDETDCSHNAPKREALKQFNESRRRSTLVTAALAQTAIRDGESRKILTALAASLSNQAGNSSPLL